MSPEQCMGEPLDARSDIYSLGCVLYEMLTGRQPFEADNPVAVAFKHVHEAPLPPTSLEASIPPALEAVVLRAMEKDPASRFPSVADMTSALNDRTASVRPIEETRRLPVAGTTTPTPTEALPRRADRPPPRRRNVLLLLLLVALALIAALAFAAFDSDPRPAATQRRSPSATPSTPAPTTPPPTAQAPPPPPDSVEAAAAALDALVADGLADGTISEKAAEEIGKRLEDALDRFREGDTEQAVDKLDDIVKEVEKAVDEGEIAHSREQRLRRAIEDVASQMIAASPSEGD
jgi:serine/threonine-protein kinase